METSPDVLALDSRPSTLDSLMIEVLYEDGPCLVVNKPGGLLTQAVPGVDSLEVRIKEVLKKRAGKTQGDVYLGVPHRLDRPVSGGTLSRPRYPLPGRRAPGQEPRALGG